MYARDRKSMKNIYWKFLMWLDIMIHFILGKKIWFLLLIFEIILLLSSEYEIDVLGLLI